MGSKGTPHKKKRKKTLYEKDYTNISFAICIAFSLFKGKNMQLDLFNTEEISLLQEQMSKVKESSDNVRRGLFARHNELCKLFLEQQKEIDELKAIVSKLKDNIYVENEKLIDISQMAMVN